MVLQSFRRVRDALRYTRPWHNNWNNDLAFFPRLTLLYVHSSAVPFDWPDDAPDAYEGWTSYWDRPASQACLQNICGELAALWILRNPGLQRVAFAYGGMDAFGIADRYMEFGWAPSFAPGSPASNHGSVVQIQNLVGEGGTGGIQEYNPDPFEPGSRQFTRPSIGPSYFEDGFTSADVVVYRVS